MKKLSALKKLSSFFRLRSASQVPTHQASKPLESPLGGASYQQSALLIREKHGAVCTAFSSRFGGVPMGTPGEAWPTCERTDPRTGAISQENLFFLGQMNLKDAPFVPEILRDLALISFFVDPAFAEGDKCCVRAYKTLEELVPLVPPPNMAIHKACAMVFEKAQDTPCHSDPILQEDLSEEDEDKLADAHLWHAKIGGFASPIQSYPFEFHPHHSAQPAFCLQFLEIKCLQIDWIHSGAFYVARGRTRDHTNTWFCDIQFY